MPFALCKKNVENEKPELWLKIDETLDEKENFNRQPVLTAQLQHTRQIARKYPPLIPISRLGLKKTEKNVKNKNFFKVRTTLTSFCC